MTSSRCWRRLLCAVGVGAALACHAQAPAPAAPVLQAAATAAVTAAPVPAPDAPAGFSTAPPTVEPSHVPLYLPVVVDERSAARHVTSEAGAQAEVKTVRLLYEAGVLGSATVRFADTKRRIESQLDVMRLARPDDSPSGIDWDRAEEVPVDSRRLLQRPESADPGPLFASIPAGAASSKKLAAAAKDLADWLYYNQVLKIDVQPELGIAKKPKEDARQFAIRVQQAAREQRDAEIDKLRKQYEKQIDSLADKLDRAQQSLNAAQAKAQAKQTEQWVNIGESILGAFMGRSSRRAVSSATSKWNQASQAAAGVEGTRQSIAQLEAEKQQLEAELAQKVQEITARWEGAQGALVHEELKPRRSDVDVQTVTLGWAPFWQITYDDGGRQRTTTLAAYALPEVG